MFIHVVISADDRREAAIDAGAVSFILKPISADVARNIGTYVIPKMEIGDHVRESLWEWFFMCYYWRTHNYSCTCTCLAGKWSRKSRCWCLETWSSNIERLMFRDVKQHLLSLKYWFRVLICKTNLSIYMYEICMRMNKFIVSKYLCKHKCFMFGVYIHQSYYCYRYCCYYIFVCVSVNVMLIIWRTLTTITEYSNMQN